MILVLLLLVLLFNDVSSQFCQQCANRRLQYAAYPQQQQQQQQLRNYNFNFEKFFSQFPGFTAPQKSSPSTFSSAPSAPNSRVFNVYGQDAEAFGSAIGKSIGQRIQQTFGTQPQDPTYDIQFTSPSSSSSSAASSPPATPSTAYASLPPSTASYGSYGTSSYGSSPSSYPTSTSQWPSTHPPEDLPTVQQAFQAQQRSYGSTPSMPQSMMASSNGFGGMPGMLPPPQNPQNSDCPWCSQNGGYRAKRLQSEEEERKKEEKI